MTLTARKSVCLQFNISYKSPDIRLYIASLDGGGSERVCAELCNGFVKQGINVELLLVNAFGPYLSRLDPRVRVVDFKASRGLKALIPVSKYLLGSPEIPVLVFGFHLGAALLLASRLGLHRSRVIYREGSSPRAYVKPSKHRAYRWLIGRADKIIAQNRSAQRELESLGVPAKKITVISNPCSLSVPHRTEMEDRCRAGGPLILAVGRLTPEKGFERLIRAFAGLHREDPAARLAILGEGKSRSELTRLIAQLGLNGAVDLPGFVSDPAPWYRKASLFVLSSRYEGQPNALMDAIVHECPVLCVQARGGAPDLMEDCGLSQFIVPENEFERSFASRVRDVLTTKLDCWAQARGKLLELSHPDKVIAHYLAACGIEMPRPSSATVS